MNYSSHFHLFHITYVLFAERYMKKIYDGTYRTVCQMKLILFKMTNEDFIYFILFCAGA